MIIEIEINKDIIEHMIKEQELNRSRCMIDYSDLRLGLENGKYGLVDVISQEFLLTLLREYKKQKPKDYLKIKIKKNEK